MKINFIEPEKNYSAKNGDLIIADTDVYIIVVEGYDVDGTTRLYNAYSLLDGYGYSKSFKSIDTLINDMKTCYGEVEVLDNKKLVINIKKED